ncbi:hypothetical protein [Abiotrophia defectiva]|uniref:hypothetical protein n=1 Tax=Abiotrophia defectiva TaxID=46125 RepID=UPI0030CBA48E
MKFGLRTPSLKKRLSARTSGAMKRKIKRALIPGYGRRGRGWLTNPRKALYNKIYRKTTVGCLLPFLISASLVVGGTSFIAAAPSSVTIEERSKQWIDEHLKDRTLSEFTQDLIKLEDEKLKEVILFGHKKGTQLKDDFDIIGRDVTIKGKVVYIARPPQKQMDGKYFGTYLVYLGDKPIEDFQIIEDHSSTRKDMSKEDFFLGKYPEEKIQLVLVEIKSNQELEKWTNVEGVGNLKNYVLKVKVDGTVEEFSALINELEI